MSIGVSLASALVYGAVDFLGGLAARRTALLSVLLLSQAVGLAGIALLATLIGGTATRSTLLLAIGSGVAFGTF